MMSSNENVFSSAKNTQYTTASIPMTTSQVYTPMRMSVTTFDKLDIKLEVPNLPNAKVVDSPNLQKKFRIRKVNLRIDKINPKKI